MACAGTPRIVEHVVKPARSNMNTTTTTMGKVLRFYHNNPDLSISAVTRKFSVLRYTLSNRLYRTHSSREAYMDMQRLTLEQEEKLII